MPLRALSCELLSVAQMGQADRAAMAAGVGFSTLMDHAGAAVAIEIMERWPVCAVTVLCGPGNNGGDGLVVARLLQAEGWPVRVALTVPPNALSAVLQAQAGQWSGLIEALNARVLDGAGLVVDAVFGAGLNRALPPGVAGVLAEAARRGLPIVAVDVPSGLHGDTGRGPDAVPAQLTVTFFRRKPGHVLEPGRSLCGELVVADIGIPNDVLDLLDVDTWLNVPRTADSTAASVGAGAEWLVLPVPAAPSAPDALSAARAAAHTHNAVVLQLAPTPVVAAPSGLAIIHPVALPGLEAGELRQRVEQALRATVIAGPLWQRIAQALWIAFPSQSAAS